MVRDGGEAASRCRDPRIWIRIGIQLEAEIWGWRPSHIGSDLTQTRSPHTAHAKPITDEQFLTFLLHPPLPTHNHAHTQAMQSQMLTGGAKLEDVPAFRAILAREHRRIRGEEGRRWGGDVLAFGACLLARGWALHCTRGAYRGEWRGTKKLGKGAR